MSITSDDSLFADGVAIEIDTKREPRYIRKPLICMISTKFGIPVNQHKSTMKIIDAQITSTSLKNVFKLFKQCVWCLSKT